MAITTSVSRERCGPWASVDPTGKSATAPPRAYSRRSSQLDRAANTTAAPAKRSGSTVYPGSKAGASGAGSGLSKRSVDRRARLRTATRRVSNLDHPSGWRLGARGEADRIRSGIVAVSRRIGFDAVDENRDPVLVRRGRQRKRGAEGEEVVRDPRHGPGPVPLTEGFRQAERPLDQLDDAVGATRALGADVAEIHDGVHARPALPLQRLQKVQVFGDRETGVVVLVGDEDHPELGLRPQKARVVPAAQRIGKGSPHRFHALFQLVAGADH